MAEVDQSEWDTYDITDESADQYSCRRDSSAAVMVKQSNDQEYKHCDTDLSGAPKSSDPKPPPAQPIATDISVIPIKEITDPVTTGGKNFIKGLTK